MSDIVMYQTAQGRDYEELLAITQSVNRLYCAKNDIVYESHIGLERGYYDWHACFNRIVRIHAAIESGFRGWFFHMDADAFVYDLEFKVSTLISAANGAFLASPGGFEGRWDINDGVFLLNLGDPLGRRLGRLWFEDFMSTSDEALRSAKAWYDVPSDQQRIHDIFRREEKLQAEIVTLPHSLFNHENASFVRQILRSNAHNMGERIAHVRRDVDFALRNYPQARGRRRRVATR